MTEARAAAEKALALVEADPQRAYEAGARLVADPGLEPAARSVALRAMGVAARNRADIGTSIGHLEDAVAAGAGEPELAALARMSLAASLTYAGRTREALAALDTAADHLQGADLARLEFQRAGVLQRLGRTGEALAGYERARPLLQAAGDEMYEAHLLANRGLILAYAGKPAGAEHDLRRALALYQRLGLESAAAITTHNLGFVATQRGAITEALAWFDRAEADLARLGRPLAALPLDRCEAFLAAGLSGRARELAQQVVQELSAAGMEADRAEALLMLAEATLLDGDAADARAAAAAAGEALRRQRRPGWLAHARYSELRSRLAEGTARPEDVTAANRLARELERAGQAVPALRARVVAARSAVALGRPGRAGRIAGYLERARSAGPAELRIQAWLATAELRHARADARGAARAARAGLDAFDRYQAALGATDARAHAARHVAELSTFALRRAVESGEAARLLDTAERTRARSLRFAPVRPPDDAELAADLDELRAVTSEIRRAELEGDTAAEARSRQRRLQESVRRRAMRTEGASLAAPATPGVRELRSALDGRTLLEYVTIGDRIHGVTLRADRIEARDLCAAAEAHHELESLRFALRRLVDPRASDASRDAAGAVVDAAAARLEQMLVRPLRPGDGPVVVVPTASLFALPWAALPALGDRPLTVAPSAARWLDGRQAQAADGDKVVVAAGPGLPQAAAEVRALRRLYPEALSFSAKASPVAGVLRAIDGAATAHLACHGRHSAQNPLFSSLQLSDGPLTVYDMERLAAPPATMVLSACDSGLSAARPGDELVGLTASLLALGTANLVASVATVPDAAITRQLMVGLHKRLRGGTAPAAALLEARRDTGRRPDGARVAMLFQCFGSG